MSEFAQSFKNSLSSAAEWTEALPSHLANEAATIWNVTAKAPKAIWNELSTDVTTGFKGHPERATATAVAGTIGFATMILGRRAPTIMSTIARSGFMKGTAAIGLTAEGASIISGTASLLSDGWNAKTSEERDKLGDKYSKNVAGNLTPIVESLAAGAGGAAIADRALAYSPRFNVATFHALTERRDYNFRAKFLTRDELFNGSGSFELNPAVSLGGTKVNMELLTQQLEQPSASNRFSRVFFSGDKNVEVMREVDLASMRASAPMRGTPWGVNTAKMPEGVTYHNHHPLFGIQAGIDDTVTTTGLNIVRSGGYRGYYVGQRPQNLVAKSIPEILAGENPPALRQLVIHDEGKRAFVLERNFQHDSVNRVWKPGTEAPQYVDYDAATKLLRNIDVSTGGATKAIKSLPRIEAPLHPDDLKVTTAFTGGTRYDRKLLAAGTK